MRVLQKRHPVPVRLLQPTTSRHSSRHFSHHSSRRSNHRSSKPRKSALRQTPLRWQHRLPMRLSGGMRCRSSFRMWSVRLCSRPCPLRLSPRKNPPPKSRRAAKPLRRANAQPKTRQNLQQKLQQKLQRSAERKVRRKAHQKMYPEAQPKAVPRVHRTASKSESR